MRNCFAEKLEAIMNSGLMNFDHSFFASLKLPTFCESQQHFIALPVAGFPTLLRLFCCRKIIIQIAVTFRKILSMSIKKEHLKSKFFQRFIDR